MTTSSTGAVAPAADDDGEVDPLYDVTAHLDALFSVPLYRSPQNPRMERWRELGERLLAFGETDLEAAYESAYQILQMRLEAKRRRRRRRRRVARPAAAVAPA
ncbi:MAG TPA: hypothetical protein VN253_07555 [Kofleriaceae bacterium]|nr:hypothetical protein [Kofleriaceae bacterium]